MIEITDKGLRLEKELAAQVLDIQESFFSPLTADEQSVLTELMRRCIARHLGAPTDDPALL
jgi:DNA-binding MarR family transcriptional regulator